MPPRSITSRRLRRQQLVADAHRVGGRAVFSGESVDNKVDLARHRFAVQLVQIAGGGAGEELRPAHAEVFRSLRRPLEGAVRDGNGGLHYP